MSQAVFVTGATGQVGSAVIESLRQSGQSVVAATRGDGAAHLPDDIEQRAFDFAMRPAALETALTGCDRLFLLRPPAIADVETFLFPLIDAARRRALRQVVFLSLQGVQHNRAAPHHAVERYLMRINAPYTFLRPNFFMQNLSITYGRDIRERDEIYLPAGRSFTAFIDTQDIGAVTAAVFTKPGHVRKAYTLSGEQTLSYRHVASILSDVLGRPIRYARPSEEEYLARLAKDGKPVDYIAVQKMIYRIVRLNASAVPNRAVRRLTGNPATTFREFAKREQHAWLR